MEFDGYLERMGTDTVGRYDVTPLLTAAMPPFARGTCGPSLFGDSETFAELRADLTAGVDFDDVTHVVGIDALGFVLGGAIAAERGVGFVPVRKGGKLPYADGQLYRREFTDYSDESKTLELHPDRLGAGDRVLVVDEWVETGAQMCAATELVEEAGASVLAVTSISVPENEGTAPLFERYEVHSIE